MFLFIWKWTFWWIKFIIFWNSWS